jgi:hypothetical protein
MFQIDVSIAVKPSDLTAFLPKSIMTSLTEAQSFLFGNSVNEKFLFYSALNKK